MAKRAGLNCTLSYPDATGTTHSYQVRAGGIGHGIQMIFTESQARTARAFYPHRSAMEQFSIVVLLKNWNERTDFVNWLSSYANYAIDPDIGTPYQSFPWMQVVIPSRGFTQWGVPLSGYEWGAHTGMMMFTPQILFESVQSPGSSPGTNDYSTVINQWLANSKDPAIQYFYPFGTQLSGSQQPWLPATPSGTGLTSYSGSPSAFNSQGNYLGPMTTSPTNPGNSWPTPAPAQIPGTGSAG
jgi:hypothetical protein